MTTTTTTTPAFDGMTADDVTTAYRAADVSGKAAYRAAIGDAIDAAIRAGDIVAAGTYVAFRDAMTTAPKSTVTVDYAARIADMRATLVAAIDAIDAGRAILPDGVPMPVGPVSIAGTVDAASVVRMTTVTGRKSGRGNVIDYVSGIMADASGPMTIADIRSAWSATSDYPTSAPSAGAIGAAFDRIDAGTADADFDVVDVDGRRGASPAA